MGRSHQPVIAAFRRRYDVSMNNTRYEPAAAATARNDATGVMLIWLITINGNAAIAISITLARRYRDLSELRLK
ncbi:hypothetical protein WBP07_20100 (plasmid) [Novosphingobium sp. BL-8A]|uniref:hypothetical protein n=1 Tax=Novosphingobium sp. BL-8A TaxID=3127639 RepID=UPI003757BEE9